MPVLVLCPDDHFMPPGIKRACVWLTCYPRGMLLLLYRYAHPDGIPECTQG